jgi:hypothetical protein
MSPINAVMLALHDPVRPRQVCHGQSHCGVGARQVIVVVMPGQDAQASAVEAVAELDSNAKAAEIEQGVVTAFLAESEKPSPAEKSVTDRVKLVTREDERAIFFETRDRQKKDAWIHRNYIKK